MKKSIATGRDDPNPKITRQKPAPQPAGPKSIANQVQRESDKRKNGSR